MSEHVDIMIARLRTSADARPAWHPDESRRIATMLESLQAENARLMSEVARLREALGNAFCPRPVHGRPAFDTVKGCQQSDNCGCDLGEAFAKP